MMVDQNVLYVVAFLAFANVLGYLAKQNTQAVIFFLIVGFLTTYFSKNMIVVLLTAMVTTNLFVMSRMTFVVKEGMTDTSTGSGADTSTGSGADTSTGSGADTTTDADADDKDTKRPHESEEKQPVGASMDAKKKKASYKKTKYQADQSTEGLAMPATEEQEEGGEDYAAVPSLNGTADHIDYSKTLESAYGNLEKILGEGGMTDISKTTQNLMEQQKMLMDNMNQMQPMMKAAEGFMDKVGGGQFGGLLSGILGGGKKK